MTRYNVSRFCCTTGHCSICAGGGIKANRERVKQAMGVPQEVAGMAVSDFLDYEPYVYEMGDPDPFYAADQQAPEDPLTLFSKLVDQIVRKRGSLLALTTDVDGDRRTWWQAWEMVKPTSDYTSCTARFIDHSPDLAQLCQAIARAEGVTL